jgi:iron complex outermembrane receptor protein
MLANGNPSGFYNVVTKKPTGITSQAFTLPQAALTTTAPLPILMVLTKDGKLQYRLKPNGANVRIMAPVRFYKPSCHSPGIAL